MKLSVTKTLLAFALVGSIGSSEAQLWAPYGASSASNSNTILQNQLDGVFADDANTGNSTTPQYGANNLQIFGGDVGNFSFGNAAMASFGQGIKGFSSGNGSNFSGDGSDLSNVTPGQFTFEVATTILNTVSSSTVYGLASRYNFQLTITGGQLSVLMEQASGNIVNFTAVNTPVFTIGDEFHLALTYDGTNVGLFATNLSTSSTINQLTLTGSSATTFNASHVGSTLVLGSRDPYSYPDPASAFQFDMVRYSSVAYTASEFEAGLSAVPEPGTTGLVLLAVGALILAIRARKAKAALAS